MSNNDLVTKIYTENIVWLKQVCNNFSDSKSEAEDLLQDVLLKLLEMENIEKLKFGDSLNLFYVYKMIRSIALTNKKKTQSFSELEDIVAVDTEYDLDSDIDTETKLGIIDEVLSKAHWYDAKLFQTYFEEDHSLTSLAEATGISRSSVYNTISKVKRTIRSEYTSGSK